MSVLRELWGLRLLRELWGLRLLRELWGAEVAEGAEGEWVGWGV